MSSQETRVGALDPCATAAQREHRGRAVDAEIAVDAPPERAWRAWADPEKLAGWFVDRAVGEGRVGETMTWIFERFGVEAPHRILESVPGERIVFGPASGDVPPFVLEVTMTRVGGETRIRVVHSGFGEDAAFDEQFTGIDSGWRMALATLGEYLERHFGESKTTFLGQRPTEADPDRVYRAFTDPDRMARWLVREPCGAQIEVGVPIAWDVVGLGTVTGRVLAATGSEISVRWEEIDGVLELKSFGRGRERMVGVRGLGWGLQPSDARRLETAAELVSARLVEELDRELDRG